MNRKKVWLPILALVFLLMGAGGMYVGMDIVNDRQSSPTMDQELGSGFGSNNKAGSGEVEQETLEKFRSAFEIIQESYYEEVDSEDLLEGAISGMLQALGDPYSVYMNEEVASEFLDSLEDSFEGIGAEVSMVNGKVTIVSPFKDSPADQAGLRPNDQILKIAGEDIAGLSLQEAVAKIRGKKGTAVILTIERASVSELLEIEVIRGKIPIETVHSDLIEKDGKKIGILELTSFSINTAEHFEEELKQLEKQGIDGLIIDVRGNPGGYLQSVEEIGNFVIPEGKAVVQIESRDGGILRHISSLNGEKDFPIVGLINEGSASASEILAGALKEAGDYELVGKTTFGKGTVQQTKSMGDGSEIKLTIYKWLTSDGNFINEVGVEPTIEVDQPEFFYVAPISLTDGEKLSYDMNDARIVSAQKMLEGIGYSPERDDGYFSQKTREAVEAFQADVGIEVTGTIDTNTADLLQQEVMSVIRSGDYDNQLNKAIELLTK